MHSSASRLGIAVLLLCCVACVAPPPHAVVTVEDPDGIAEQFDALFAGRERSGLVAADVRGQTFPLTILVTAESGGEASLWVEARQADTVLGRGHTLLETRRDGPRPATVTLRPTCVSASECADIGYCSGTKICSDSVCGCIPTLCGDGLLDPAVEECDDGNLDADDTCTDQCTSAVCGDGVVRTGVELCDDGNDVETDGGTTACGPPTWCGPKGWPRGCPRRTCRS